MRLNTQYQFVYILDTHDFSSLQNILMNKDKDVHSFFVNIREAF